MVNSQTSILQTQQRRLRQSARKQSPQQISSQINEQFSRAENSSTQKIKFRTSRGGDYVELTPQEAQEAVELAKASLNKGGDTIVFFGRSKNVRDAGNFLVAEALRKKGVVAKEYLEKQTFQTALDAGAVASTVGASGEEGYLFDGGLFFSKKEIRKAQLGASSISGETGFQSFTTSKKETIPQSTTPTLLSQSVSGFQSKYEPLSFLGTQKKKIESFEKKLTPEQKQLFEPFTGTGKILTSFNFPDSRAEARERLIDFTKGLSSEYKELTSGKKFDELSKFVIEKPEEAAARASGEFIFFAGTAALGEIAGVGLRTAGRAISASTVEAAIERATIKSTSSKLLGFEEGIARFGVNLNRIPELQGIDIRNVFLRRTTFELSPRTTLDAKIIPKIKQEIIEVIGSDGRRIAAVRRGTQTIVQKKGKVFSREILGVAIGKIDGETAKIINSNTILKLDLKKGLTPVSEAITLEKVSGKSKTILSVKKDGGGIALQKITGKGEIDLISETEFRKGKIKKVSLVNERLGETEFNTDLIRSFGKTSKDKFRDISDTDVFLNSRVDTLLGISTSVFEKRLPAEIVSKKPSIPLSDIFEKPPKAKAVYQILKTDKKLQNVILGSGFPSFKVLLTRTAKEFATPTLRISKVVPKLFPGSRVLSYRTSNLAKQDIRFNQRSSQVSSQLLKQRLGVEKQLKNLNRMAFAQSSIQGQAQRLEFSQASINSLKSISITGTISPPPPPPPPPPGFPGGIIGFPKITGKTNKRIYGGVPYDVYIKKKKIADNLTRKKALDFGAYVVDNVVEAQFEIRKSKGNLKKSPIDIPTNYYAYNLNKFRNYRVIKGKPFPLKNKYIEKQRLRLDTAGEVADITAARFIKSRKRKKKIKFMNPTRKIPGLIS